MSESKEKKELVLSLLRRIKRNDLFALGELMEIKQTDIRTIAFSILNDISLCEDVVNDVLIIFIQNIYNFKNDDNINGWLNTVTINLAIDLKRKTKNEVLCDEGDYRLNPISNDFEERVIDKMITVKVLEKLPEFDRLILLDKILNKLSFTEIALKYNISKKIARTTYEKAKQEFKRLYQKNTKE